MHTILFFIDYNFIDYDNNYLYDISIILIVYI